VPSTPITLNVDDFTDGTPPGCPHTGGEIPLTGWQTCPSGVHGGVGVGRDKNCAVAAYSVTAPFGATDVKVTIQWGHAASSDKSYMAFDETPTTSSPIATDADSNSMKEYSFGELAPGAHTFLIGAIHDGNYYTMPWCSIEIDWGTPAPPAPPPGVTALPLGINVGIDVDVFTDANPASCPHTGTGTPSTSFEQCPAGIHGGVGVGLAKNCAIAGYKVHIPTGASSVSVTVHFGHSSWSDKTYLAFDETPTGASQHSTDADSNTVKTFTFGGLAAGDHQLNIGAADDGNYYTLPWCSIEITLN